MTNPSTLRTIKLRVPSVRLCGMDLKTFASRRTEINRRESGTDVTSIAMVVNPSKPLAAEALVSSRALQCVSISYARYIWLIGFGIQEKPGRSRLAKIRGEAVTRR